jgi:CBS-domain-containing membrane protein
MARRVGIPVMNARMLIHDSGDLGLEGLYGKSGMPRNFFPAVKAAIAVAREMSYDGEPGDRERYARRMLERVLTQYGDLGVDFDNDDLEYLLTKMNGLPATSH